MACLRGKHLVQLALQSHKLEVPANQNKLKTPSIVKDKSSVPDKTVHCKIQGSDLEVIDTHKYDTYFPSANREIDISCWESDLSDEESQNGMLLQTEKGNPSQDRPPSQDHPGIVSIEPNGEENLSESELKEREEEQFFDYDDTVKDPDYVPETETNGASSNEQEINFDSDEISIDHEETVRTLENRSKRKKGASNWKKNSAKQLRMEGKPYKGMKKVEGKWDFFVDRAQRILIPRNCSKRCDKSAVKKCCNITEDDRKEIFTRFWNDMNWEEKKVYINSLVEIAPVKEKTAADKSSRRSRSYKYYLRKNNERLSVCKNLFLSTFGIGEKMVYAWVVNSTSGIPEKRRDSEEKHRDQEKRHGEQRQSARSFLDSLPNLESHYCRASSTKLYLEPLFDNYSTLYTEYKKNCESQNKKVAGRRLFQETFDDLNMGLYSPRKDQCDVCCSYDAGNIPEEEYQAHQSRKLDARMEKNRDKETAENDDSVKVITMDVQAVLLCPKLNDSALYYKTKLQCHNFTIYDLKSKDVDCYFWHEGEADLSSNSFSSCIANYIENAVAKNDKIKHIILYSDGCTYQNRNVVLTNTLCHLTKKLGIEMTQKILEKGHTQMEVDSSHSVIERKLKKKNIYVPQNYVELIESARPSQPYTVHYVDHSFFRKYSDLNYYTSIRPGTRVGDPVVVDIRALHYSTNGDVTYKLMFSDEFRELPRRARNSEANHEDPGPLHDKPLAIKKSKFDHLMALKHVIPSDYHPFYDKLLHQ